MGNDPYVALDKLAEKQRWLRDRERGVAYPSPVTPKLEGSRLRVDEAIEQYFKNLQSQGKDRKTIRAYKLAIEEFRQSCTKKFIDEIEAGLDRLYGMAADKASQTAKGRLAS